MEDFGPSSVTMEEAAAKLIGFEYLPEHTHLEEALDVLAEMAIEDFSAAEADGANSEILNTLSTEIRHWVQMRSKTIELLTDLEKGLKESDRLLVEVPSDTCRLRLTTLSVFEWAKHHHNILIPDWEETRGSPCRNGKPLDNTEHHGEQLFVSIAALINELLSRIWPGWNRTTPDLMPRPKHRYFDNGGTVTDQIAKDISAKIDNPEGKDISRKITDHVNDTINYLRFGDKEKKPFTGGEIRAAHRTAVGLHRLLDPAYKSAGSPKKGPLQYSEEDMSRFINNLQYAKMTIRCANLKTCLTNAMRLGISKNF